MSVLLPPSGLGDLLIEQRLRQLEREKKLLIRQNGIAFYRPHERQDWFHSADYKYRYARTGNRFGKSECGCAENAAQARGERTWYKYPFDVYGRGMKIVRRHEGGEDHPLVHSGIPQRPTKGLIICADWDKAEEIFTSLEPDEFGVPKGKLVRMLPKDTWDKELNGQGNVAKILIESVWGGTSTIYLDTVKSFKGNSLGQESSDWDWIHIDEPCPQEMWTANARGLIDRGGRAWFTCTPLTELWINDMFLPREHARQLLDKPVTKDSKKGRTLFWTMTGSSYDNPYTDIDNIEDFTEGLSEDEIEARIEGKPRALTGTIYKEFDPGKHVYHTLPAGWTETKDGIPRPPQDATVYIAIDTHPVNPTAVLFAAVLKTGHVMFFDEIYAKVSMKELCEIIYDKLSGLQCHRCLVEPAAWVQDPDGGCLAFDLADNSNLPIEKAPKDLNRGIFRVREALLRTDVNGRPVLRFAWHLMETLWEFDRYVWDTTRGREGKPVDRDDHMMECLYRLVTVGLDYLEPDAHTVEVRKSERHMKLDLTIPAYVGRDNMLPTPTRARYGDDRRMTKDERAHAVAELAMRAQMDGIAIV